MSRPARKAVWWERVPVRIAQADDSGRRAEVDLVVDGAVLRGGAFGVHRSLNSRFGLSQRYWTITHIPTGHSVSKNMPTEEAARRASAVLDRTGVDWFAIEPTPETWAAYPDRLRARLRRIVRMAKGLQEGDDE